MARERTGFIVSRVSALIEYVDASGEHHKISKAANVQAADSKNNLTDAQKQTAKIKHAEQIIRATIADLKGQGATKCKGSIETGLYARVGYTDDQGRRHDRIRAAESRTHARELIRDILRDLEDSSGKVLDASRMTFADLAVYFQKHYLKPAEYIDGRKVEGVRSLKSAESAVNALKKHFGKQRLQSIRYSDLRAYRAARLKEPTPGDRARHKRELKRSSKAEITVTRKIATVNRELAKLRRMLNIAQREGWIRKSPFAAGETLISLADEQKRERILTRDEERRLLGACDDIRRAHLRPIIVCALDTGMRRGEILSLRWRDVDFDDNSITIQAFNIIPYGPDADLAPTWSDDMVTEAYNIGQMLSDKTTLRRLAGFTRKGKPTKWTRELTARARKVYEDHRQELWDARDDWNHYLDKARSDKAKQDARERIKREYLNIPERILDELLSTEPGILARELTIEELDLRRDDGELISPDRLKAILNTKADTNGSRPR